MRRILRSLQVGALSLAAWCSGTVQAQQTVWIHDVPDYDWYAGCFGSATGNLMGFWDRHGYPNFYTGPTNDGLAPLDSYGDNIGIRSLWAARAGFDGRPEDQLGHIDNYWAYYNGEFDSSYESTAPDPYILEGRAEHEPDCIGDFIGASQNKWTNLNGECDGNIDAFSFNFWDKSGQPRTNFIPPATNGKEVRDLQSGLLKWTQFKGRHAVVVSQLVDFNPETPDGAGFTADDLKAEIDAGYPVMLFLQQKGGLSRSLFGMPKANPRVHGMLAYGYGVRENGDFWVMYRTSWGGGASQSLWKDVIWESGMHLRGVITYRPMPQITHIEVEDETIRLQWEGPNARLVIDWDESNPMPIHRYVLERSDSLSPANFQQAGEPTAEREVLLQNCCPGREGYFRVRLATSE